MKPISDRRRSLRRTIALAVTGAAASACGGAKAPTATTASSSLGPTPAQAAASRAALTAPVMQRDPAPTGTTTNATVVTGAGSIVARGAGADLAELARPAIAALGGAERFVEPSANVVIKPNICEAYHGPEYAATTNPDVLAAVVGLCLGAGAARLRVRVMDAPFGVTGAVSAALDAAATRARSVHCWA